MLYTREIVHSPERFEQWHLTHTILRSQSFEMLQVRQGGYGVHDIDFWVERPTGKGFSIAVLGLSGRGRFLMEDGTELTEKTTGVYCVWGSAARFKPVDIVWQEESYILVTPTEGASATRTLRAGDEVITAAEDLFDGKVINK